ncbi:Fe-S cluster assembly ATPase SufC [Blattabacterium cuenoti]|uniref:Fe-S cluster assembly ATPase SufC n=1 Tax=Blattabacterium cuenoti TaxID=1653831 RepID=UPI00163C96FC|nr:Fe-S cluster assembly ATPase SufC [Blattabacterium cuenoti]
MLLNITNLHISINGKKILKGINLDINQGEIHVIMGPNASGKSTLASIIAGKKEYNISQGNIFFMKKNLIHLSPEQRAHLGIFLSFQNPIEIPGISIMNFIKTSIQSIREKKNMKRMSMTDMILEAKKVALLLNLEKNFIYRSLNDGFSGGEKKKNEMFQMMMLNPIFSILDEIDSGLDIDALRIVAKAINVFKKNRKNSILIITHYKRLLDYINLDYKVHVLYDGKIIKSGNKDLSDKIEKQGYDWIVR